MAKKLSGCWVLPGTRVLKDRGPLPKQSTQTYHTQINDLVTFHNLFQTQNDLIKKSFTPIKWRCREREFAFGRRTYLMGVLNVTPDSFSDGGRYLDPQKAFICAQEMAAQGADIIDIGGESSRPGAEEVPVDEEFKRVVPLVKAIARNLAVPISVDTRKAAVARGALENGACIVNDISALTHDPGMAEVVREYQAGVVLMHMKGSPRTMQSQPRYEDPVAEIKLFLDQALRRAEKAGISLEHCAIDPGIGFGKTVDHNLEILRRLDEFLDLNVPILIGTSRKSFLGEILNAPEPQNRVYGTLASVVAAVFRGAGIVRVHDVAACRDVLRVTEAILNST